MNLILDPVWPWSYLWEVLQRNPTSIRLFALATTISALLLAVFVLARASRRTIYVTGSALAVLLVLVARHAWPVVHGTSFWLGVGGVLAVLGLLIAPGLLAGISLGTYLGGSQVSRGRLVTILCLRLLAFLLALIAIARPALAWIDRETARSQLLIMVDRSRSMTVQDAMGKTSRWNAVQQALGAAAPALERLREEMGTEVRLFSFADDFGEWNPDEPGEANGNRSELGQGLRSLLQRRDPRLTLRGALLLSDGADNGGVPALGEASRFRSLPSALHTFVVGNPATTPKQNDIAITSISVTPTPFVPLKGKMKAKVAIDARGFENNRVPVCLRLELPDPVTGKLVEREVSRQNVVLPLTTGNEVTFETDAPAVPGEYRVKVLLEGSNDDFPANNEIQTFVTVSKEGIAVLLVDRLRPFEPQYIFDALRQDARISITPVWVTGNKPVVGNGKLPVLDEQPFDAIILGDVSVAQLKAIDNDFLTKIERQLARGAGLLALGGYINLGNGDWKDSVLANILPLDLSEGGQIDTPVRIIPTDDGKRLASYLFRISDDPDLKSAWEKLPKLDGAVPLKLLPPARRGLDMVLATADDEAKTPIMVMRTYAGPAREKDDKGGGRSVGSRILVFGGDTTFRWVRKPQSLQVHHRFWRQMATWLARQEDAQGSVWVRPDATSRRIPARGDLSFAVGVRGKGGGPDLRDGKFNVEVTSPDGTRSSVVLSRSTSETRGVFKETKKPGVYKITVNGEGKDPSGEVISGQSSARVIVYDEDIEMLRPAADVEFMRKLANAGGGEAFSVEQLAEFLNRMAEQPLERARQRMELRPDWRTTGRSGFLVAFFAAFVLVLSLEWGLRRWWGMV